ncbi:MAG: type II toxin-antitoxin system VapC family toxin [Rhodospirillaceae bacterium]|nr:type II toxin-antitoxin system VapC family toxin [Rhodospirillaceae bacterium]
MVVIDASALVELLFKRPFSWRIAEIAFAAGDTLHAPHLVDVEVIQVIRRHVRVGAMTHAHGARVVSLLADLPLERHRHDVLLPRIWDLRDSFSAYDAAYVALAQTLPARLLTCDGKLAAARPPGVEIILVR